MLFDTLGLPTRDPETGRSRGIGFVEMATAEGAIQAINDLDLYEVDGRQLKVSEAHTRSGR